MKFSVVLAIKETSGTIYVIRIWQLKAIICVQYGMQFFLDSVNNMMLTLFLVQGWAFKSISAVLFK